MPSVLSTLAGPPPNVHARDCELLLAHILGKPREWLLAHPETPVRPVAAVRYRRLLRRLERGEPLPYLTGEQWFYGRPFTVNRHVLIPRPETERLVELAIDRIQQYRILKGPLRNHPPCHSDDQREEESRSMKRTRFFVSLRMTHVQRSLNAEYRILDLGTGSGCIAVTLAKELLGAHVIAIDTSPTALRVARANAQQHGVAERITFLRGNLLEPLTNKRRSRLLPPSLFEATEGHSRMRARNDTSVVMLANLPYLTTAEWRTLPRSIRAYEPREALDGGPDGLSAFRALLAQLRNAFQISNYKFQILLEIDPRRKRALTAIMRRTLPGWEASWHRDLSGRYRVLDITAQRRDSRRR